MPWIRFTSRIMPPYLRRAKSIEELLPQLYLKGISTGDFSEALAALLGSEAPGLSASALTMVFKLCQSANKKWQGLNGSHHIAAIIQGVKFKDGEKLTDRRA